MAAPSWGQRQIIDALGNGYNVHCNSVAGSGKTSTVLHLARANPSRRILLLTYNRRLKEETRERVDLQSLHNVEVHSYHAMGFKYYDPLCARDDGLTTVVEEDRAPREFPFFDIMVLDEAQDLTWLLYAFVRKIARDYQDKFFSLPQYLIIGDSRQTIYHFKGADARFLELAPQLYPSVGRTWQALSLDVSFRISQNICGFVNDCMLNFRYMRTNNLPGPPVRYVVGSPFSAADAIGADIVRRIAAGTLRPEDIFVLAPSVRVGATTRADATIKSNSTPMRRLENFLVEREVPVYVSLNMDTASRDKVAANKVIFTTFHQSKGLERPYVVVFNFTASYFQYYAREDDPAKCPNTLYVAATRAKQELVVLGEQKPGEHLPFLRRLRVRDMAEAEYNPSVAIWEFWPWSRDCDECLDSACDDLDREMAAKAAAAEAALAASKAAVTATLAASAATARAAAGAIAAAAAAAAAVVPSGAAVPAVAAVSAAYTSTTTTTSAPVAAPGALYFVQARHDYNARSDTELSFRAGAMLIIYNDTDYGADWSVGSTTTDPTHKFVPKAYLDSRQLPATTATATATVTSTPTIAAMAAVKTEADHASCVTATAALLATTIGPEPMEVDPHAAAPTQALSATASTTAASATAAVVITTEIKREPAQDGSTIVIDDDIESASTQSLAEKPAVPAASDSSAHGLPLLSSSLSSSMPSLSLSSEPVVPSQRSPPTTTATPHLPVTPVPTSSPSSHAAPTLSTAADVVVVDDETPPPPPPSSAATVAAAREAAVRAAASAGADLPSGPPSPVGADLAAAEAAIVAAPPTPGDKKKEEVLPISRISVTDMLHYLPTEIEDVAVSMLALRRVSPPAAKLKLPAIVSKEHTAKGLPQDVSDLNGYAIPAMLETEHRGTCTMYLRLRAQNERDPGTLHSCVSQRIATLLEPKTEQDKPEYFLEIAALYKSALAPGSRGYISVYKQLIAFHWMRLDDARTAVARLRGVVCETGDPAFIKAIEYERQLTDSFAFDVGSKNARVITVEGAADMVTPTTLWEVKCTSQLDNVHKLQLALYAWLWYRQNGNNASAPARVFRLFNLLTGETWELTPDYRLDDMADILLRHRFHPTSPISDEQFLRHAGTLGQRSVQLTYEALRPSGDSAASVMGGGRLGFQLTKAWPRPPTARPGALDQAAAAAGASSPAAAARPSAPAAAAARAHAPYAAAGRASSGIPYGSSYRSSGMSYSGPQYVAPAAPAAPAATAVPAAKAAKAPRAAKAPKAPRAPKAPKARKQPSKAAPPAAADVAEPPTQRAKPSRRGRKQQRVE